MSFNKMSYLATLFACALLWVSVVVPTTLAENIYLQPDSLFYTSGTGDEFDLELRLDAGVSGVRLYQVYVKYEPSILDTVSSTLGDLFSSSGFGTYFRMSQVVDVVSGDTALRVEALLLGPGATVDGPGLAATIRFKIIGAGKNDFAILDYTLTDVNNDPIPGVTASGAVGFFDAPPEPFALLSPLNESMIELLPSELVTLSWESTTSAYAGEGVKYRLEYGTSASFQPGETTVIDDLLVTSYDLPATVLSNNIYYWRVTAIGDIYGFEQFSETFWFDYSDGSIEPSPFNLVEPAEGELVEKFPGEQLTFHWQESFSPDVSETVEYTLEYSTTPSFEPLSTVTIAGLLDTFYTIDITGLIDGLYYWQVTAEGMTYNGVTASNPYPGTFIFSFGAIEPGDFDLILPAHGAFVNINNDTTITFDWGDAVSSNLEDTTTYTVFVGTSSSFPGDEMYLVNIDDVSDIKIDPELFPYETLLYWQVRAVNKFGLEKWSTSINEVTFFYRGDVNSTGIIDISDLLYLVDYFFLTPPGPPPVLALTGDVNCSGELDISDLLYLVDFFFKSPPGPFPGCM